MRIIYSKVTVEPTSEPLTLLEAKLHLRVDHSEEDSLISLIIRTARETAEKHTNRSLITQTRVLKMDSFPRCREIMLPNGAVSSVTSISYIDQNEVAQTLSTDEYYVDVDSDIARIRVKNYWPATFCKPNVVTITYVAGYGSAVSVPSAIKSAMLLLIGHLYENREQVVIGSTSLIGTELPFGVEMILSPFVLEQSVVYDEYR